ncbi:MAG: nucleotide exchange factor GrpE [Alphaproteobacteria bacterium]|nr:nucleotide exchange factor GrpE [Alphaproteobacteria bacterium]|tara:strand:- start:4042 stop:4749 length:708 start_codon:yes stop_codon:yes gene_type:complete
MTEQNNEPKNSPEDDAGKEEKNMDVENAAAAQQQPEQDDMQEDSSPFTGEEEPPMFTEDTFAGADSAVRIAELEQAVAQEKERALRALAEAENTRRRALKDREDAGKYAISRFARDLLDVLDNFSRAMDSVPEDLKEVDERINAVITGVESVQNDMLKIFTSHGIQKIEPLDERFDPNFHEVMFEAPGSGKPEGVVIQVIEPGYVISGRLLRPARVGVAKGDPGAAPNHAVDEEV